MGYSRKNILLSMTGTEKKFMGKVNILLEKRNVNRGNRPEMKREALEKYREKQEKICCKKLDELVNEQTS